MKNKFTPLLCALMLSGSALLPCGCIIVSKNVAPAAAQPAGPQQTAQPAAPSTAPQAAQPASQTAPQGAQPPSKSEPVRLSTAPLSREGDVLPRQNEVLQRARTGNAEIVFVGDSITQGWEGSDNWKNMVAPHHAMNLGVSGDRTEHVLWRLEQAPLGRIDPKVVVLMIGTNNTWRDGPEDILAGIRAVVDLIVRQCPGAAVIVLDIPPRGQTMNDARGKVVQVNQALSRGGLPAHARFVRVSDQFVRPDGTIDPSIMPDALHFSPKGYAMWGASIKPELESSLKANSG